MREYPRIASLELCPSSCRDLDSLRRRSILLTNKDSRIENYITKNFKELIISFLYEDYDFTTEPNESLLYIYKNSIIDLDYKKQIIYKMNKKVIITNEINEINTLNLLMQCNKVQISWDYLIHYTLLTLAPLI